jgi:anti-sigma regulatory factor (Ser/Thr protein kinase)
MNDHAPTQSMPIPAGPTWPLRTHLELAALASAVPCARAHVRLVAAEWGLNSLSRTAELLTSELVTNAVKASGRLPRPYDPGFIPVVQLWLASDQACLVICVWDGNDSPPVRADASPYAEGGRGLLLVEALGSDWGTCAAPAGKVVWVRIPRSR